MRYWALAGVLWLSFFPARLCAADDDPFLTAAREVERAFITRDAKALAAQFDLDMLCERIRGDIPEDQRLLKSFLRGIRARHGEICAGLCESIQKEYFQFLRLIPQGDRQRALYRRIIDEGDTLYYEVLLQKNEKGQARIVDVTQDNISEYFSENIRGTYFLYLQQSIPEYFKHIAADPKQAPPGIERINEMRMLLDTDKPLKALEVYRALPDGAKASKAALALRLAASTAADEAEWLKAADEFDKTFPDLLTTKFARYKTALEKKEFPAALKALDDFDRSLGGDPYIDTLRAVVHNHAGEFEAAEVASKKAIAALPELFAPLKALLHSYIGAKDYVNAVKTFKEFEERFGIDDDRVLVDKSYAEFRKSPEFKAWWESRKK
jgi:hypothetical protein